MELLKLNKQQTVLIRKNCILWSQNAYYLIFSFKIKKKYF